MKKVLLVVSLIFVLLAGCNKNEEVNNNVNNNVPEFVTENQQQEVVIENHQEEVVKKSVDDLVTISNKDGDIIIPKINIDSKDVDSINEEIDTYCKSIIEKDYDYYKVRYDAYLNDSLLSLNLITDYPDDSFFYQTYNIDISTGKRVDNLDLIKSKNYTSESFLEDLKVAVENEVEERYGKMKDDFMGSENEPQSYLYILSHTLNDCSIDLPMYVDKDGVINVIIGVYAPAGAEKYSRIIKVN